MKKWKCYRKTDEHKIESVFDEKGLKVCDIHYCLNEESEANAKLISCAPEILEMLQKISNGIIVMDRDIDQLIKKATTI